MIRRLFKKLVGVENLARMSATGEGVYDAVPRDIAEAVQCK